MYLSQTLLKLYSLIIGHQEAQKDQNRLTDIYFYILWLYKLSTANVWVRFWLNKSPGDTEQLQHDSIYTVSAGLVNVIFINIGPVFTGLFAVLLHLYYLQRIQQLLFLLLSLLSGLLY